MTGFDIDHDWVAVVRCLWGPLGPQRVQVQGTRQQRCPTMGGPGRLGHWLYQQVVQLRGCILAEPGSRD